MTTQAFRPPPLDAGASDPESLRRFGRQLGEGVGALFQGKMNVTASLTLTANAASSTLTDARLSPNSVVLWDAMTANAAAELGNGTIYVTSANRNKGAWTVTHANAASTDRTFRVLILG